MRFSTTPLMVAAAFFTCAPASAAQDLFDAAPAHIVFLEGRATLSRDNLIEPAVTGAPVISGDRIRTDRGRVDIQFPDGSVLDLDEYSAMDVASPVLVRLTEGRLLLSVAGVRSPSEAARFTVDAPTASVASYGPGEYRVSVILDPSGQHTELAVLRGSASLSTEDGSVRVRAAERSVAWDRAAPTDPQSFNSARFDAFDHWSAARRNERLGTASARYLPADLRMYGGNLDRNGEWSYQAPYGNVWTPRVAMDWQPYSDGSWSAVPRYGWTWVGGDAWAWPTHHYGRWGHGRQGWFWIPSQQWAPAWVTWSTAPGYVGWSPLGYDGRPVFALSISAGARWTGWTVVSREHFGARERNVRLHALSAGSLTARTPFVEHGAPPPPAPHSMSRRSVGTGPGQSTLPDNASLAARVAVPRGARSDVPAVPGGTPRPREPRAESLRPSPRDDLPRAPRAGGAALGRVPGVPASDGGARSEAAPAVPGATGRPARVPHWSDSMLRSNEPTPEVARARAPQNQPRNGMRPTEAAPSATGRSEAVENRQYRAAARSQAMEPPPARAAPAAAPESRPTAPREERGQRTAQRRDGSERSQPAASAARPAPESAPAPEAARGGATHGSRRAR